jgi:hypothetical protein
VNVADVDLLGETAQPIVRLKLLFLVFDPGVDSPQDAVSANSWRLCSSLSISALMTATSPGDSIALPHGLYEKPVTYQ